VSYRQKKRAIELLRRHVSPLLEHQESKTKLKKGNNEGRERVIQQTSCQSMLIVIIPIQALYQLLLAGYGSCFRYGT
jgi:hypothetical protein